MKIIKNIVSFSRSWGKGYESQYFFPIKSSECVFSPPLYMIEEKNLIALESIDYTELKSFRRKQSYICVKISPFEQKQ